MSGHVLYMYMVYVIMNDIRTKLFIVVIIILNHVHTSQVSAICNGITGSSQLLEWMHCTSFYHAPVLFSMKAFIRYTCIHVL